MISWDAPHLYFVHKFSATFYLHLYKIARHFHDLAGCGKSVKNRTVQPKAGRLADLSVLLCAVIAQVIIPKY